MKPINQLGRLFIEVPKIINGVRVSSKPGEPTPAQFAQAWFNRSRLVELDEQIAELTTKRHHITASCPHDVCYDVSGYPYDERYCAGCDKHLGSI